MGGTLTLRLAELFPDAMAGIVLVNPSVLTLRKDAKYCCPCCATSPRCIPAIVGDIAKPGVVEPGYNWHPGQGDVLAVEGLAGGPGGPAEGHRAGAAAALDGSITPSNRSTPQIVRDEVSSTDVTDIVLERSYHVATMDYDAELIFTSSVEFIEKVTAGLP